VAAQTVRVCGRRGLVTFCAQCEDWRPIISASDPPQWGCGECKTIFPEVETYEATKPVEVTPFVELAVPQAKPDKVDWASFADQRPGFDANGDKVTTFREATNEEIDELLAGEEDMTEEEVEDLLRDPG